jgi:heme/copper-type cytochrome/quinol oxidase subunit 3
VAERAKLGMLLFIVSESVFFLLLVLAYVFYHRSGGEGPTAATTLDVARTGVFSAALFASSFTVWRAGTSLARGHRSRFVLWLLGTILLGAAFLAGQGVEYAGLLREGVTVSRDLFGATFFTLTGFHGFHVLVGLIMLTTLLAITVFSRGEEPDPLGAEVVSMYWHFVDGVWAVIFPVVYLWKYV